MDIASGSALDCCFCGSASETMLLLDCLHNCCEDCLISVTNDSEGDYIICLVCKDSTCIKSTDWNPFAAAKFKKQEQSSSTAACAICKEKTGSLITADLWCRSCSRALCDDCSQDHRLHVSSHIIVQMAGFFTEQTAPWPSLAKCRMHGKKCKFICMQCELAMCSTCAQACMSMNHTVEHVHSTRSRNVVKAITFEVQSLHDCLAKTAPTMVSEMSLNADLQQARISDTAALQRKRSAVLEAVDWSYKEAANKLSCWHAAAQTRALATSQSLRKLRVKIDQATAYIKLLLAGGDEVTLFQQHQQVLARLRALLHEARNMDSSMNASAVVSATDSLPVSQMERCRQWIEDLLLVETSAYSTSPGDQTELSYQSDGTSTHTLNAKCLTGRSSRNDDTSYTLNAGCLAEQSLWSDGTLDESYVSAEQMKEMTVRSLRSNESFDRYPTNECPPLVYHPDQDCNCDMTELSLWLDHGCIDLTVALWDLTVTIDGTLLLACDCLIELDLSGRRLSSWSPLELGRDHEIWAVEELSDRRVAIGLCCSHSVHLLRRCRDDDSTWLVDMSFDGLQGWPLMLSARDNLLGIVEGTDDCNQLVLFEVLGQKELLRQRHECDIRGMTVTSQLIVIAGRVEGDPVEKAMLFFIEGLSHKGQMLWKWLMLESVEGICTSPSGAMLYLALPKSGRLAAIRSDSGKRLGDVCGRSNSIHSLSMPRKLSLGKGARNILAVICDGSKPRVITYEASSAA